MSKGGENMEIKNELPKKSPLSMQMDLSRFELATADEKRQQDRMRESTTFFKDGIRKLKKDKISISCGIGNHNDNRLRCAFLLSL